MDGQMDKRCSYTFAEIDGKIRNGSHSPSRPPHDRNNSNRHQKGEERKQKQKQKQKTLYVVHSST